MTWQIQDAKQRFSELVRRATTDGAQVVTKHGEEVAVVIDIHEYRRLRGAEPNFKNLLLEGPDFEPLDLRRDTSAHRPVDLA